MPSILIINPNSSASITENLATIIKPVPGVSYTFFTGPSHQAHTGLSTTTIHNDISIYKYTPNPSDLTAPAMIDNSTTSVISAAACLAQLQPLLERHDAFLVACFSDHPLVNLLREALPVHKPVVGIFQASVLAALSIGTKFAIVTTAKIWERLLDQAVLNLLGSTFHYAGTFSTGLSVLEIHDLPMPVVTQKLVQKAREAVDAGATSLILGCAGLSGLDKAIRKEVGKEIVIIDSVICGVEALNGIVRNKESFYGH